MLVDIFLTRRLSKSLAFCEFASVNFEPCERVGTRAHTLVSHSSRLRHSLGTTSITLKKKNARRLWFSSMDKQQSLMVADIFYFLCFTSETTEITENYTQATFSTPNADYFTIKALLYIQRETQ